MATTPAPSPLPPEPGADCLSAAERRGVVRFRAANGATLGGVLIGTGKVGVVLAHQSDGDLCQWWPFVGQFVQRGFRVLAFDFEGYGASTTAADTTDSLSVDVRAAATRLRAAGASRVVLVGASMGGTAALAATGRPIPGLAGAISLSGPVRIFGSDAAVAAAKLRVPVLLAAGETDSLYAADARSLFPRVGSRSKQLLVVPGANHGVALLAADGRVKTAVFALLEKAKAG